MTDQTESVIDVHVRPHEQSLETARAIIMNAVSLGFPDASHNHTATDAPSDEPLSTRDLATITITVTYDEHDHDTETSVRTALENMVADAPVDIEATEINHASAPTQALPAPDVE